MAVTTVTTPFRNEQRLGNRILRGFRAAIDAFVSSRMQDAVSEAASLCTRGSRPGQDEGTGARASAHAEMPQPELRPLDDDIISATIPAFFIGRNKGGLWVARESSGQIGGIFLLKNSALAFARAKSAPRQCAFIFPSGRFELDLENEGNPLARHFASSLRIGREIARCVSTAVLALLFLAGIVALQAAIHVHLYL